MFIHNHFQALLSITGCTHNGNWEYNYCPGQTALHCTALHCIAKCLKLNSQPKRQHKTQSLRNEFILWRLVTSNLSSQWLLLSLKKSSRLHKLHHKKHFLISDLGMASHDLWWRENDLPYNAFSIPIESLAIGWTCSDSGWLVCIKGKVTLQFPGHGGKPD